MTNLPPLDVNKFKLAPLDVNKFKLGGTTPPAPTGVENTLKADTSYPSQVGAEQVAGAKKIAGSISSGAKDIQTGQAMGGLKGLATVGRGIVEGGAGTVVGTAQTALAPVTPLISKLVSAVTPTLREQNPVLAKAYDAIIPKVSELASKHPESATAISDLVNALLLGIGGGAAEAPAKEAIGGALSKEAIGGGIKEAAGTLKETAEAVKALPKTIPEAKGAAEFTKGMAQKDTQQFLTGVPSKEAAKIQDLISPKPTIKEAKLAESQGRLIKAKEPTIFKSGTLDKVIPSDKVIKASQTIQREIPNASKMNEATLYKALDDKTTTIAKQLKPELEKTPIKKETVDKLVNDWESLKKKQSDNIYVSDVIDVKKYQKDFETKFIDKTNLNNLNDIWEKRKSYDDSVPENVKEANDLSSDKLLAQKEIWLQNRGVLNDAINDISNGMGDVSRNAFSDMSDMYNAKQNILSKAKIETVAKPSKLEQFGKSDTGKFIKGAIGTAGVIEGGKKLVTGSF